MTAWWPAEPSTRATATSCAARCGSTWTGAVAPSKGPRRSRCRRATPTEESSDVYDGRRTIGGVLEQRAAEQPDREIVRFRDGSLTYATLDERANRIANAFRDLGLTPGDKVAILLPNGPEFLATWFGVARAGLIEVPLNVGLRGDLLAYALN